MKTKKTMFHSTEQVENTFMYCALNKTYVHYKTGLMRGRF
jgi:hypothetical protein